MVTILDHAKEAPQADHPEVARSVMEAVPRPWAIRSGLTKGATSVSVNISNNFEGLEGE